MLKNFKSFFIITIHLSAIWGQNENNVCNTLEGYFSKMNQNPDCWYDSDVNADVDQLAKNHGLILENHDIKTDDAYILTTFRLKSINGLYGKEVIFLQHGLGSDAECFMVNGNKSIAFFLSNQGFDVWLGNYRGSEFSRHETLSRDNAKFWDFSFHEHGLYDLSANFKYINSKTKKKIIYIGHSMGGTAMGIYASMKPKEAETYVKHAILMAPTFYMRTTKGLASINIVDNLYSLLVLLPDTNLNVLLATNSWERQMLIKTCFLSLENLHICLKLVDLSCGDSQNKMAPEKLPRGVKAYKNVGLKDVLHYAQMIHSKNFRMFDYGHRKNMFIYNTSIPASYQLSKITIPVSLLYLNSDNLATKLDVTYTFETFRKQNWHIYGLPYNHISFLIDRNVDKTFYPLLIKLIDKYNT